jgi:hypothetical protein
LKLSYRFQLFRAQGSVACHPLVRVLAHAPRCQDRARLVVGRASGRVVGPGGRTRRLSRARRRARRHVASPRCCCCTRRRTIYLGRRVGGRGGARTRRAFFCSCIANICSTGFKCYQNPWMIFSKLLDQLTFGIFFETFELLLQ